MKRRAEMFAEQGARLTRHAYEGEDHFLLLSQLDSVLADIAGWMQLSADRRPAASPR